MEIDARLLRYLLAVSDAGSFSKAAENLNISQPALSVAISRLEDVVGAPLVNRGRHGARLNAAGEILVRHGTSLVQVLRAASEEIQLFLGGIAGPLVIGGTPLTMVSIIPDALAALSEEFGHISARLLERPDETLLAMLQRHELDIAVSNIGLREQPGDVEAVPLFSARTVAVVRPQHPLADRPQVSLAQLAAYAWALPPAGGSFRQVIEALFATHGVAFPKGGIEVEHFAALKHIVMNSDVVSLLSDQIVRAELKDGSLVALPLQEATRPRLFGLHYLKERKLNAVACRFIDYAKAAASRYEMPPDPLHQRDDATLE